MSTNDNWRSGGGAEPAARGRGGGRGTGRPPSRGGRPRTAPSERKPAPSAAANIPASSTPTDSVPTAARPKPSRRSSKLAADPVIVVNIPSSTPAAAEHAPAPAARPSNRRQRSQAQAAGRVNGNAQSTGSNAASRTKKGSVPPAIDLPLKSDPIKSGPQTAPLTKDVPPHLTARNTEIDALVEKVRASAIVRPSTPGSHIDWAGDEDDSLPDLDDWVVKPAVNGNEGTKEGIKPSELISPIILDGLRPLPEPMIGRLSPSPTQQPMPMPTLPEVSTPQSNSKNESTPSDSKPIHHPLPAKPAFKNQRTKQQHPKPSAPTVSPSNAQKSRQSSPEVAKEEVASAASEEKPAVPEHDTSSAAETGNNTNQDVPNGGPPAHSRTARGSRHSNTPNRGHRHVKSGAPPTPANLVKDIHHQRTQSSPPAVLRRERPIITMDAISRLTRTIAASNSETH